MFQTVVEVQGSNFSQEALTISYVITTCLNARTMNNICSKFKLDMFFFLLVYKQCSKNACIKIFFFVSKFLINNTIHFSQTPSTIPQSVPTAEAPPLRLQSYQAVVWYWSSIGFYAERLSMSIALQFSCIIKYSLQCTRSTAGGGLALRLTPPQLCLKSKNVKSWPGVGDIGWHA